MSVLTPHPLRWGCDELGVISWCLLHTRTRQAGWQSLKGTVSQGLRSGLNNEELLAVQRSLHVLGAAKLLLQELASVTQAHTQLQHEEACSDAISRSGMLLAQHAGGASWQCMRGKLPAPDTMPVEERHVSRRKVDSI